MRIDILTLFPGMFEGPLTESILQRARERRSDGTSLLDVHFHDLRTFGTGKYKQIDDRPYGGGAGMVFLPEVVVRAIEAVTEEGRRTKNGGLGTKDEGLRTKDKFLISNVKGHDANSQQPIANSRTPHRIYFSPRGKRLTQSKVERMAKREWLILLCGHYEGIDQRITDGGWIDEEISIGDYVLTGGELPAMVLIDAVARHIPGVLGKDESAQEESFSASLGRKKEYPHYTRPEEFLGMKVPDVLLSGHHKEIEKWRRGKLL